MVEGSIADRLGEKRIEKRIEKRSENKHSQREAGNAIEDAPNLIDLRGTNHRRARPDAYTDPSKPR